MRSWLRTQQILAGNHQSVIGCTSLASPGAIAGQVRENGLAEVHAIGAAAVNQAVKALIIARGYLDEDRTDAVFIPFFNAATIDGEERAVLREQRSMPISPITAIPIKVPIATPVSSLAVDHKGGDR